MEPLIVVDGANVVGSVPDGWWRDRRGAAERLRDALVPLAALLLLLLTLTIRPLRVGSYVLGTEYFPGPNRWCVQWVSHTSGAALVLDCQGWNYAAGWYRGRRLR